MDLLIRGKVDAQLTVQVEVYAEQAAEYVRDADAARTREAYGYHWQLFTDWCELHGFASLPCAPQALAMYIGALAQGNARPKDDKRKPKAWLPSSIALALSAINQQHVRLGHGSPRSHLLVRAAYKGICNRHGIAPVNRKTPVLARTLSTMVEVLPDTLMGARDRALLLVGFTGAFRRAEIVALEVSDFTFMPGEGVVVRLRKSKTDQAQRGRNIALPYSRINHNACPVHALRAWLEQSGIVEGFVFRSVDRHQRIGATPLRAREVARIVKRTAAASGTSKAELAALAGHSLRAGLVTSAAKADKSVSTIMRQTGHGSVEMVMRYVREADLFTDNAADGLL